MALSVHQLRLKKISLQQKKQPCWFEVEQRLSSVKAEIGIDMETLSTFYR